MKTLLAIAVLSASFSAFAGNDNSNGGCQGNCPTTGGGPVTANGGNSTAVGLGVGVGLGGAGGQGGKGGEGGSAAVFGSGNSSVKNDNSNVGLNLQGQQQGQHQDQTQTAKGGNASATGGNATGGSGGYAVSGNSSAQGNGAGNTTSIDIAAPVIPKPAANSAYVGDLPQLPQGSCRLFIGGGATNRDGSATGLLVIGNDQTCLSTRSLEVMKQINAMVGKTVFGKADMLDVGCKIEGMENLAACKK
jgi:hypothetical protein